MGMLPIFLVSGVVATAVAVLAALIGTRRSAPDWLRWNREKADFTTLLSFAALGLAVVHLALFIGFVVAARPRELAYDLWDFISWLSVAETPFDAFWHQYESHRLVIPGALVWLDLTLLGGAQISGLVLLACGFAVWLAAMLRLLRPVVRQDPALARMGAAAVVGLSATVINGEGFIEPFRSWAPLVLLSASFCLYAMTRTAFAETERHGRAWLAVTLATAVACNFSGAPGVVIWPALLLSALLLRQSWRCLALIMAVAGLSMATYLHGFAGFVPTSEAGGIGNLLHPVHLIWSLMAFVGQPLGQALFIHPLSRGADGLALFVGFLAALGCIALLVGAIRRRPQGWGEAYLLCLVIFTLGWCATTVIKHQPLPGSVPWRPYTNSSDFLQAMILCSVLGMRAAFALGFGAARWVYCLMITGILALALPVQGQIGLNRMGQTESMRLRNLAYVVGVRETDVTGQNADIPDTPEIRALVAQLAVPPFGGPVVRGLGAPVTDLGPLPSSVCDAELLGGAPVEGGERMWGRWSQPGLNMVLVANEAGKLVGMGRGFNRALFSDPVLDRLPAKDGWIAYVSANANSPLRFYGASTDGTPVCTIVSTPR